MKEVTIKTNRLRSTKKKGTIKNEDTLASSIIISVGVTAIYSFTNTVYKTNVFV